MKDRGKAAACGRDMGTAEIVTEHPLIEEILGPHRAAMGACYAGYRNHAYRMLHYVHSLTMPQPRRDERVAIASAFHDLPAVLDWDLDYTTRAADLADRYLSAAGLADWSGEVRAMIENHHKVTRYRDPGGALVEAVRKADWIDVSLGRLRFGLPPAYVREVEAAFPVAGLLRLALPRIAGYAVRHPRRPLPFMRW